MVRLSCNPHVLRSLALFSPLTDAQFGALLLQIERRSYAAGRRIVTAGEGADGDGSGRQQATPIRRLPAERPRGTVIAASADELAAHAARLAVIEKAAGAPALWVQMEAAEQGTSAS